MMSEIRISKIDGEYYINGKKVEDPLSIPIKERIALDAYKRNIEDGLNIKSTFKNIDFNKDEKSKRNL